MLNTMIKPFLFLCLVLLAASATARDLTEIYPEEFAAAEKVKTALRTNDRTALAAMITYPIRRPFLVPPVRNQQEFLAHWDEFFDEKVVAELLAQEPEEFGWRGMALGKHGELWFNRNQIWAVNTKTALFEERYRAVIQHDKAQLHPSVADYDRLHAICTTKDYKARVYSSPTNELHFAIWKKNVPLGSKPLYHVRNGDSQFSSGGNGGYTFKEGEKTYEFYTMNICGEESCGDGISISRNEKRVFHQSCIETK